MTGTGTGTGTGTETATAGESASKPAEWLRFLHRGARGLLAPLLALVGVLSVVPLDAKAEPSAPASKKDEAEATEALASIAKSRASLKTLSVSFTQERELSLLSSKVKSTGSLLLARPDKMRWKLEPPDEATYWVSKAGIAYKTKDGSGKVTSGESGAMAALLDDVLVVVGGDLDKLTARYTIAVSKDGDARVLTLTPKAASVKKMVNTLVVTVDEQGVPKRLVMNEPEGDSTTIVFGEAKRNAAIDPALLSPP